MGTNSFDSLNIILASAKLSYRKPNLQHLKILLQEWAANFYNTILEETQFLINDNTLEVTTDNKRMFNELKQFTYECDFLKIMFV